MEPRRPDRIFVMLRFESMAVIQFAVAFEIDLLDRSWETHGHATNPAFDETVLHVFVERSDQRIFYTRTKSNR
jgi:hypothetical protein